jgi:hypothetical protein
MSIIDIDFSENVVIIELQAPRGSLEKAWLVILEYRKIDPLVLDRPSQIDNKTLASQWSWVIFKLRYFTEINIDCRYFAL